MKRFALCASLVAACGVGLVIVPSTASARSGGGGGGAAAAGIRGGLRAGPAFFHGLRPTFARGVAARLTVRGMDLRRQIDLRRQRTSVLPSWPAYGDFDPFYYSPLADAAVAGGAASASPASEPVAASQQPPARILVVTPGCRTQEQKVQSESGGEQVIRITRCY